MSDNQQNEDWFQMNIATYIPLAVRTEPDNLMLPSITNTRLLHAAVGVSTKVAELAQAGDCEAVMEKRILGDTTWYLAIATNSLVIGSLSISTGGRANRVRRKELMHELHVRSGEFLGMMRKCAFNGKQPSETEVTMAVFSLWQTVANLCAASGQSFGDVMAANVADIKARCPDKFTDIA